MAETLAEIRIETWPREVTAQSDLCLAGTLAGKSRPTLASTSSDTDWPGFLLDKEQFSRDLVQSARRPAAASSGRASSGGGGGALQSLQ